VKYKKGDRVQLYNTEPDGGPAPNSRGTVIDDDGVCGVYTVAWDGFTQGHSNGQHSGWNVHHKYFYLIKGNAQQLELFEQP